MKVDLRHSDKKELADFSKTLLNISAILSKNGIRLQLKKTQPIVG